MLAVQFVPGFQIEDPPRRKRGRPAIWGGVNDAELILEVNAMAAKRGKGVTDAVRQLVKEPKWSGFKLNALETRYYEARRRRDTQMDAFLDQLREAFFGRRRK